MGVDKEIAFAIIRDVKRAQPIELGPAAEKRVVKRCKNIIMCLQDLAPKEQWAVISRLWGGFPIEKVKL